MIPLVVYHGDRPWDVARSLEELIRVPHPLRSYLPRFAIPLLELGSIPDEELGQEQLAGILESTFPKQGQALMATIADELQARVRDRLSGP